MGVPAPHVRDLGGDEDHPLDAALEQHPHVVALAAGRAVRVAEDGREAASGSVHLVRLSDLFRGDLEFERHRPARQPGAHSD